MVGLIDHVGGARAPSSYRGVISYTGPGGFREERAFSKEKISNDMVNWSSRESARAMRKIIELLEERYKGAETSIDYASPLELLVATILSAQCTDRRVNIVTKDLFKKYRRASDYADVDLKELEVDIRSIGLFRSKARNIKKCGQILVERFNSQVPRTMEELLELPGVARKTANIVLANAYGIVDGIAVDTHVRRLVRRLGVTQEEKPSKIERELMEIVPRTHWKQITNLLILHGRRICAARKPKCEICFLSELCLSAFTFGDPIKVSS